MPYFTLGYPDFETSLDIVRACAQAGADLMELGLPFSDPLADGPTIQHSTQTALANGTTMARCLAGVGELRRGGVAIPLVLMGYLNPILAYGVERFVRDASQAGADGFIIPDLPPEEGEQMERLCRKEGLALVYLLAPNSSPERIRLVCERTGGFVYLVSVRGITGARATLPDGLAAFVERVRPQARVPLAVGFGISTPQQVAAVGQLADGVIVGSALIRVVRGALEAGEDPVEAAGAFVQQMAQSLQR